MSLNNSEWFTEAFEQRTAFSVRYSKKLYDKASEFQRIEIYETEAMGRVLILDGCFMVTEKDSFVYHEMLVHPAMSTLDEVSKVLVIGGGDGGAVTEVVKYRHVQSVVLCEIDPMVVETCKEFFPAISEGLRDPRVSVVNRDGAAFVKEFKNEFDLILVDSTDPVGPGQVLFETSFYESVKSSLRKRGASVFQTESPFFMAEVFRNAVRDLKGVFGSSTVLPYLVTIPSYPGGLWSFTFCPMSHCPSPLTMDWALKPFAPNLHYYNSEIHRSSFALPGFVKQLLEISC
jgi:spermidine synthase